jgi:hypothetical protein
VDYAHPRRLRHPNRNFERIADFQAAILLFRAPKDDQFLRGELVELLTDPRDDLLGG